MTVSFPLNSVSSEGNSQHSSAYEQDIEASRSEAEPLLASTGPGDSPDSRERSFWRKLFLMKEQREPPSSQLYTIISMTDTRLRPRRPFLWTSLAALVALILTASVYVLVPRGVVVGTPRFVPHNWHRNSTAGVYSLQLGIHIPVTNANYFKAKVDGKINVLFLDTKAGTVKMNTTKVAARTKDRDLHFCMDASGVPEDLGLTIISICMLYPQKLMFICRAELTAETWLGVTALPTIDTYFLVDCYPRTQKAAAENEVCGEEVTMLATHAQS